jgi:3-(methylthio)propionyl---CoA ligase
VRLKQGRAVYGVDMKIVDEAGKELPWDGKAYGDLLVRGPWIIASYFKGEGGDPLRDDAMARAGSRPATWPPSTPTASCRSPTAART